MSVRRFRPTAGPQEEWRECPDAPRYHVSNYGRVRGARGGILKLWTHNGYWSVSLWIDGKQRTRIVSRLVARAFLGEPTCHKLQAAHQDGDRDNNHVSNLKWATIAENTADKFRHGTVLAAENHPRTQHTWDDVDAVRFDYESHMKSRRAQGFQRAVKGFRDHLSTKHSMPISRIKDILAQRCWANDNKETNAA